MSTPRKQSVKRKAIEEKVLGKARKFVKLSDTGENESQVNVPSAPTITMDLAPKVKLRKPRKGKKEKNSNNQPISNPIVNKSDSKSKSKRKRKYKKNKLQQQMLVTPESEEKHSRKAILFLDKWNSDRRGWKFEKLQQIWLLKNALKSNAINEEKFPILLKYVGSIKGQARQAFLHEMEDVVKKFEVAFQKDSESTSVLEEKVRYERARQLVQMLYDEESE
ncbi:unnamed protein product [Allacma fusca]|uniref:WKF domain-containing protein n=1 Tax=Allacma fusca TaxID=39272 RepID=A0A8J2JEX8_9HEXA|nr:unnamed protein product [Allacma fusca]